MDCLDVVGMIVPQRSSHSSWADVIRDDVAVLSEPLLAERADAILSDDLPVEELPHLAIGAEFPVTPGMERVVNAAPPIWRWRLSLDSASLPQQKRERWIGQSCFRRSLIWAS